MAKYDPAPPPDAYAQPQGADTSAIVNYLINSGMGGLVGLLPSLTPIQASLAQGMAPLAEDLGTTSATNAFQDQQSILADFMTTAMAGPGAFAPGAFDPGPDTSTYTTVDQPGRRRLLELTADPSSTSLEAFIANSLLQGATPDQVRQQVGEMFTQYADDDPETIPDLPSQLMAQVPMRNEIDPETQETASVPDLDFVFDQADDLYGKLSTDPQPGANGPVIGPNGEIIQPGRNLQYVTDPQTGEQILAEVTTKPGEPSGPAEQFARLGLDLPTAEFDMNRMMGQDWQQALSDYMATYGDPEVRGALIDQQSAGMNQEIAAYEQQNQGPYPSPEDYARQQRPDLFTGGQGAPAPAPSAPAQQPSGGGGGGGMPWPDFGWTGPFADYLGSTPLTQGLGGVPGLIGGAAGAVGGAAGNIPAPDFSWAGPLEQYLTATPLAQGLSGIPGRVADAAGAVGGAAGNIPAPDFSWAGPLEPYLTSTPLLRSLLGGGSAQAAGPGQTGAPGATPDNSSIIQQMLGATPLTQGIQGIPDLLGGGVTGGVSPTLNQGAAAAPSPAGPSGPPSRQQAMGQGAGASAFNIPGVNDPQLASLLSQLSTTNLPTWNSYLQSQPPASSPTAASPQTSSPTAQAASPQAGSAAAVTAMLQRIMPGFIGDLSPVVPAVLAQAQAGGHVQPSQGSAPATPGSNRLGAPPPGQGGGFRFPREAILRFIMDRAPGAVQEDRASGTRRRIETEQESARYDAENRLAQRRSAQREQIWGAEYGRNLAISNALRAAGIRPIDLELAQRNQVLAQAGIRPA